MSLASWLIRNSQAQRNLPNSSMSELDALLQTLALTAGTAWASGLNLYATLVALGVAGATGYIELPSSLAVVQDPIVIVIAGVMFCVEFIADKIPGFDTGWDAVHTFIRIPAGALLAAGAVGEVAPALSIAAALLGGGVTAVTHASKAGSRAMINTSPEPLSNSIASLTEDAAVFGGLWLALKQPFVFTLLFGVFLVALVWLLPRLWQCIRILIRRLGRWLGMISTETLETASLSSTSPTPKKG